MVLYYLHVRFMYTTNADESDLYSDIHWLKDVTKKIKSRYSTIFKCYTAVALSI